MLFIMEDASFSDKFEVYFSELGRWKVWRSILLGQVLSLFFSGKCILTTLLQSATWQFPTTGQLIVPYLALFILFTPTLVCNGVKKAFSKGWWMIIIACILDVEASWLLVLSQRFTSVLSLQLLACSGVGGALVGGAWSGQRLVVEHVAGATLGLMAVVCIVWVDVEGAPTDGKNQLVGDMMCMGGSLLYAVVTALQEASLKKMKSCPEYLAILGLVGTIVSCTQTFFLDYYELVSFYWYDIDTVIQLGSYWSVQTVFQILQSFMLRDTGSILLHISCLSSDYYTVIAGMFLFQFKFHALYLMSFLLCMMGVFLFSSRVTSFPESPVARLPNLVNDTVASHDNISIEYTVPTLDCIPIEGIEPPMSRDTTFTSFLGGPQANLTNGNNTFGHSNGTGTQSITKEPC